MLTKIAFKLLARSMRKDLAYRQSWHDNLACMAQDAGAPHESANKWAGEFMRRLIGIDTNEERHLRLS